MAIGSGGITNIEYGVHKVFWAGWESDTLRLRGAGGDIAVEYEPVRIAYRLIMHHPMMTLTAISADRRFDEIMRHPDLPFVMQGVCPRIEVMQTNMDCVRYDHTYEMNTEPMMRQIQEINPETLFRVADREKEIIVEQADMSVIEHLEAIKELQSDRQKELREAAMRLTPGMTSENSVAAKHETVANVVSLRKIA
jgi:hypothetical protein